ncbi:hypothetical protein F443_20400 [Phytophthora nicotianae P1569]|uniref:Uncharacterized protein n=1 Tax=Phytophthora nicotianae P1569 TaxID=1317065 RepID=V9E171_PHYNI|nr:hypothetical protein F443_20400 [Phytophthora nicotianae P1569]
MFEELGQLVLSLRVLHVQSTGLYSSRDRVDLLEDALHHVQTRVLLALSETPIQAPSRLHVLLHKFYANIQVVFHVKSCVQQLTQHIVHRLVCTLQILLNQQLIGLQNTRVIQTSLHCRSSPGLLFNDLVRPALLT